jgi:hypothetical protein
MTTKERQRRFRQIRKEKGLVRGDVWVYPHQWPEVRELEKELQERVFDKPAPDGKMGA